LKIENSRRLFEEARKYIPGGVDSPVRSYKAVGGTPLFIDSARGALIRDADGNEYLDYVMSWGALILGHAHPLVVEAVCKAAGKGTSFGAPTYKETELARMICGAFPSIGMVRFVSSGTEAAMSALRLARAYTGRDKIIKFAGCYHGHADSLLAEAGSGAAALGIPGSAGVTKGAAADTLVLPYNDIGVFRKTMEQYGERIACVIVEPAAGNMGTVPGDPAFLVSLRSLTREFGALLIFDEVISGFRLAYGGAQTIYNITPDLTCLGKIIGGGLPAGAFGGRKEIMEYLAPLGPVYQAGTLSGNPVAMSAGVETLKLLLNGKVYGQLEAKARALQTGFEENAGKSGLVVSCVRSASMLTLFFTGRKVVNYDTAQSSDQVAYTDYFRAMLESGVYLPPAQFEALFVSASHTDDDIERTITVFKKYCASLKPLL